MRGAASSMKSLMVEQPVERSWRRRAGFARKRKRSRNRACCSLPMQTSGGLGDGVVSDTSPLVLSCMVLDEGVADVGWDADGWALPATTEVVEDSGRVRWDVRTLSSSLTVHVEESVVDSGRSLPFCYRLCVAVVDLLLICCWFDVGLMLVCCWLWCVEWLRERPLKVILEDLYSFWRLFRLQLKDTLL
jgi:hypothetical protein